MKDKGIKKLIKEQFDKLAAIQKKSIRKEDCIKLLKADPSKFEELERKYKDALIEEDRQLNVIRPSTSLTNENEVLKDIIERIVIGCIKETYPEMIDVPDDYKPVELDEIYALPKYIRPQFTERYTTKDCNGDNYPLLMWYYDKYLKAKEKGNTKKARELYNRFRQGLDLMDLDFVMYEMLGCNKNSIGYWYPKLYEAVQKQQFFKVPETVIRKIPVTMLQMTRLQFDTLTPTTMKIINEYCRRVFNLDDNKEYFIKNGVFSSKFDFRNCRVIPSEVKALGEYLTFIHNQASTMAGFTNNISIYGPATTNEWCVREFIDTDNTVLDFANIRNGHENEEMKHDYIYHGLELRNELRAFVDFDNKKILGIVQYWNPAVMNDRFNNHADSHTPTMTHDAIVYGVYEEALTKRFEDTKDMIMEKLLPIVENTDLKGQWSIDIMEKRSVKDYANMSADEDDDFYIIDMALASQSAFADRFKELIKQTDENWIPELK